MITLTMLLIGILIFIGIIVFGSVIAGSMFLVIFADVIIGGLIVYGIYKLLTRKKKK